MLGNILSPVTQPRTPPTTEAINEYSTNFITMSNLLYPSALSVPISSLCSSTILVIVVRHTRAATNRKNTGKIAAIDSIFSALDL